MTQKEKNKYIIIAVASILLLIAIFIYLRFRALKEEVQPVNNPVGNSTTSVGSAGVITTPAYHGTDTTKWKKGDYLYATKPTVNMYATTTASPSNIVQSFSLGNSLGKFVGMYGQFAAVDYVDMALYLYPTVRRGYIFTGSGDATN